MMHFYSCLRKMLFFIFAFLLSHIAFSQPIVGSFTPASGPVGTTVSIFGSGFSPVPDSNIVYFGGVRAAVSGATTTGLSVTVPVGATYSPITVTTGRLTGYSRTPFSTTFANGGYAFNANSFAAKIDYPAVSNPRDMAIADFNGDGKADIFVTNQAGLRGSVYKNQSVPGSLSFLTTNNTVLPNDAFGVACGDLNGDGKPDLAVANLNQGLASTVTILRNVSTADSIAFATTSDSVGMGATGVDIADIDADGRPDIVVAAGNGAIISVFRNITTSVNTLQFAPRFDIGNNRHPGDVRIADLDGDGKPDMVTGDFAGGVSVYKNNSTPGNLSFASAVTYTAGTYPSEIAIGDLNGDGRPDIATANYGSASVSVFKNTSTAGTIAFDPKKDFSTSAFPRSISIGDLNGDGKPDMVVPADSPDVATVLRNVSINDTIAFAARAEYLVGYGPTGAGIGDLDGDGKSDMVVCNAYAVISVFRNQGRYPLIYYFSPSQADSGDVVTIRGLNFQGATAVKFGGVPAASFTVLSDTIISAVVGLGATGPVTVTTPSGTVTTTNNFVYKAAPHLFAFSPASGNTGTQVTITGTNLIKTNSVYFGAVSASSFQVISDTLVTAVVGTGASGSVSLTTSFGTDSLPGFTFKQTPVISSLSPLTGPVGTTVTITGQNFSDTTNCVVYFGAVKASVVSATSTTLTVTVPAGASYQPVTVTSRGLTATARQAFIITFPGAGAAFTTATFSDKTDVFPIGLANRVLEADLDGDGKADIIGASTSQFTLYRNTSSNSGFSFGDTVNYSVGYMQGIAVGDVDGDGKLDIAVGSLNESAISVYRNISVPGTIAFAPRVTVGPLYNTFDITIGDLDRDGKPELAACTQWLVTVFKNTSIPGAIAFAAKKEFAIPGLVSRDIVIADFNNDDRPDIAVPLMGSSADSICILRNTGAAPGALSFTTINLPAARYPWGATVGDVNGDGWADLVVANRTANTVSVYKNISDTGTLAFASRIDYPVNNGPAYPAISDIDGDGKPDIAVSSTGSSNGASLLKNTGTAGTVSFAAKVSYGANSTRYDVLLGDLNGDGKPDLTASGTTPYQISFFKNQTGGPAIYSFTPDSASTGDTVFIYGNRFTSATAVSFGDSAAASFAVVNDSTIIAIIGGGNSGIVSVTTSEGVATKGGFVFIPDMSNAPYISSFTPAVAGKGDLVYIYGGRFTGVNLVSFGGTPADSVVVVSDSLIIARVGNGSSGWVIVKSPGGQAVDTGFTFIPPSKPIITNVIPASGAVGSTVTITGYNFSSTTTGNIVYFGAVGATVTAATDTTIEVVVPAGATYQPVTVTVNNLTAWSKKPFNLTFPGTGFSASSFAAKVDFATGAYPCYLSIGDLDGDGKSDMVVVNNNGGSISVYRNTGSAGSVSFTAKTDYAAGAYPFSSVLGDIDGDGKKDLVVSYYTSDSVRVYRNTSTTGAISFGQYIAYQTGANPSMVTVRDIDNDGRLDIITANNGGNSVSVLKNTSVNTISFNAKVNFTVGSGPYSLVVTDLDGDGLVDIVTADQSNNTISILRNKTVADTIAFAARVAYTTGSQPIRLAAGDLNEDGKPDLVVNNTGNGTISVFRNTSDTIIRFAVRVDYTAGTGTIFSSIDNLDGDGKPDVSIVDLFDSVVSVMKNNSSSGSITLGPKINFTAGALPRVLAAGDLDGDGKPDLAVVNSNSNTVSVFRNLISDTALLTARTQATNEWLADKFAVYPNPAYQYTIVQHPAINHTAYIQVVDIAGRLVKTIIVANNSTQTKVDVTGLSAGAYKLIWSDGTLKTSRSLLVK